MKVGFAGYAPDADPTTPGVITNCGAIVPTLRGYKGAPAPQTVSGLSALAAACRGAASLQKLDNTNRVFAGTTTKLYELSSGSWTDRTRASGGDYSLAADGRWRFAQFGDVSLAAGKADILQSSTTGAFANVAAGAPKAAIVETVGNFVFLFDVNDQGALYDSADRPNGWWCSAINDQTDWTPAISTQSATGTLVGTPGKIRAGKRFGEQIVAFKDRSMFLGTYVGAPAIWSFNEVPGGVGALSQECVVNIGTPENPKLAFMGYEDFYVFDGSRPVPIGENRVKESVYMSLNRSRSEQCLSLHDRTNALVYFFYPVADAANPDKCVVWNYRTNTWGRDDRTVQAVFEYIGAATTYADVGTDFSTYGGMPSVGYGSAFWTDSYPTPAIFNTSNLLQTLDGAASTGSITTGDVGDDAVVSTVTRVKARYLTSPTSASLVNYYRMNLGDALTTDATTSQSSSRFDFIRSARWHRLRFDFTGDVELPGFEIDLTRDGDE